MRLRLFMTPVDIGGPVAVLGAVSVMLWLGWFKTDSATVELARLRHHQMDKQAQHSALQKEIESNEAQYREHADLAQSEGKLEQESPIVQRLRSVRESALAVGWADWQMMPLKTSYAADVVEESFTVTAQAGYAQLGAFLQDFEGSAGWADISHLRIVPVARKTTDDMEKCDIELVLHFYRSNSPSGSSS